MLRTILLTGAAMLIGAPVAMADGSNFQPYMFKQPTAGAQSQVQPVADTSQGQPPAISQSDNAAAASKPEGSNEARPERSANRTTRRHMANRTSRVTQRHMTAGVGTEEPVGQTWNSPSQSIYYPPTGPYAWGYAPGPAYGYGPGYGYYGPNFASAPYQGGVVEGRAAYEGPYGWDYPEVGPPIGQTMSNPPSASMYYRNTGPY
jgi:hypothetical protein